MPQFQLGVNLDALGQPPRQGLLSAAKLGVSGVQMDAAGELAPDRLTATGRREFRTLLRSFNLSLAAVNCPCDAVWTLSTTNSGGSSTCGR